MVGQCQMTSNVWIEWMTYDELDDWKHLSCFLEVDLKYPGYLHDFHDDYPIATELVKIEDVEQLISNLNNKTNYVVHYENFKIDEILGFEITNVHIGIKFEESA